MRKIVFVIFALLTLCVTSSLSTVLPARAVAFSGNASVSLKKHTMKVISGPKSYCQALIKKYPERASNLHGCDITIESDTWFSQSTGSLKSSSVHPNSCYSGVVNHKATYYGPLYLLDATLFSTFHYNNCNTPSADQPNCTRDNHAVFPFSYVNATACYSGSYGSDAYTEGDWSTGSPGFPTITFSAQSIAGAGNTTIHDYFNGG